MSGVSVAGRLPAIGNDSPGKALEGGVYAGERGLHLYFSGAFANDWLHHRRGRFDFQRVRRKDRS